jgi:hypothetical protein
MVILTGKHIIKSGEATMYKHAPKYHRTHRDDPDPGEVLDAAGIVPRGTPEFVRQVKFAVLRGGKETRNSSQLVGYLNSRNWPAPGFADTELGVLMELEVCHGETEVYTGVQA